MFSVSYIIGDLRRIGLQPGDTAILHSSYKAIGPVEGGPAGVARALMEAVGPAGLVAMPAFTFGRFATFYSAHSPSQTGAVTECFRGMPGVARSAHPTHSMALWGAGAVQLAAAHLRTSGLDVGSPYDQAACRPGARILLAGVDSRRNSYIHVCEAILGLPYVDETFWNNRRHTYEVVDDQGRLTARSNWRTPGCSQGFQIVDRELERRGQLKIDRLGDAECLALRPSDVLEAVRALIERRADALLCPDPACGFCPGARQALRRHAML